MLAVIQTDCNGVPISVTMFPTKELAMEHMTKIANEDEMLIEKNGASIGFHYTNDLSDFSGVWLSEVVEGSPVSGG